MSAKSYLVTGGMGFIGSALVRRLVEDGYSVRVLGKHLSKSPERLEDLANDFQFIGADIRDGEAVEKAMDGVDGVIHLAAITATKSFYDRPDEVLDVGVRGMVNVIDGCMKNSIGELIVTSSSEVYQTPMNIPTDESEPLKIPDPLNPRYSYASSKIVSELMAINYGRKYFHRVLICRPHNVYGPDMGWDHVLPNFITRMKKLCDEHDNKNDGNPIIFPIMGTGQETRAFEYIDDYVDGMIIMMDKGEHLGIYHIGNNEETTIADAARAVGEFYGRDIKILPTEGITGGTSRRCPDISKLEALGYKPRFKFRDGLPIMARWYDRHSDKAPELK